ncbi:hypothetical protein K443DRAFT_121636 [Laccaria amethystina LaAM-08-1]|uniref:Uncharacterized protein n=1 Tax=Laccaria amethystina LaAM-08-1 TaxID=1095629 RepID=A0A0C9XNL3_9AGAR|nr:hypothetical protein K443DRAFT_121636 [Laccaria amethystina LaAM-08-1]
MSLWDTADGMELFSVDVLDALGSFSTDERSFDGETLRGENDEPFAVFGSRKYDWYMRGADSQSVFAIMLKWTKSGIRKEEGRPITKTCKNPQSPSSIFTFAALWDPDTGFTAYEKGKLLSPHKARDFAGHRPFNPSVDTSLSRFSTTITSTSNYIDVDFRASNPPFRGPLMTPNHSATLPHTEKSRSFKPEKSMSRLSRAIKGRWSRRAQDEHWVFFEVQSVFPRQFDGHVCDGVFKDLSNERE